MSFFSISLGQHSWYDIVLEFIVYSYSLIFSFPLSGEGRSQVSMLYTYRGISKAIPQVMNQDDPNKQAIYENQLRVLAPEIEKLKKLMQFQQKAVALVVRVASTVAAGSVPPTPTLLSKLVEVLDMLSLVDTLKNMKGEKTCCESCTFLTSFLSPFFLACLNNDFSFYKRAFGFLKRNMAPDEEAFNQMLHLFLANQSSVSTLLKTELAKISNIEELLLLLINHCEEYVVAQKYVLPDERFALLRTIPYVMFLLDGDTVNVFSHKLLNWSRLKQLFKDNPVVPLYGDMQTTLDHVLDKAPNFRSSNWESFDPTKADPKVVIFRSLAVFCFYLFIFFYLFRLLPSISLFAISTAIALSIGRS